MDGEVSFIDRAALCWRGIRSAASVPLWGTVTVLGLMSSVFKWAEWFEKRGWLPTWAPTVSVVVYTVITLWFLRTVFLLGESKTRCDIRIAELEAKIREGESLSKGRERALAEVFACIHAVVHETRDSMFCRCQFRRMVEMNDADRLEYTYRVVALQLGMFEKAFRAITGHECCVTLKIKETAEPSVVYKSVAYSPSTPLDRRSRSTVLPGNQGIAQEAAITKTIARVDDIMTDSRFWPREDRERFSHRYRSVVAAPVLVNNDCVGVLCFDWKEAGVFQDGYKDIVAAFTDAVSTACYISAEAYSVAQKGKEPGP